MNSISKRANARHHCDLPTNRWGVLSMMAVVALVSATIGCRSEAEKAANEKPSASQDDATPIQIADSEELRTDAGVERNSDQPESEQSNSADTVGRGRGGAGHGRGHGFGPGSAKGNGRGPGASGGMRPDMTTLHAMFADRDKIKRTVIDRLDGAEAVTESEDETIASLIQEHVPAMEDRVLANDPLPPMTFHPIFVELIKHADDYSLEYEETAKGMKVTYTAKDPYVVMLVQEHAKLVSRFIKNGMSEIHKPYTLPETREGPSKQ